VPSIGITRKEKEMLLTHYYDPSHGWLEVPIETIKALGVADKITGFSYKKDGNAYLEEDYDAGLFLKAAEEEGLEVEITEKPCNGGYCEIRGYEYYK
jgi:hypothetical protein